MIAWILLILSTIALGLMFWRRFRLTRKDMIFQEDLQAQEEEEAAPVEEAPVVEAVAQELPLEDPEEVNVKKTFARADVHFGRKEWDDAEPLLLLVLEADSKHVEAHLRLGMIAMKRQDFPAAEVYFAKLVSLKKDPVYFSNLGAALYQQQRLVEAAEAYENALALDDKRAARFVSLGQIYHELDEHEKALEHFERAAEKKRKDVGLLMILADYYIRFERADEAKQILKKVLDLDPYNEEAKASLESL